MKSAMKKKSTKTAKALTPATKSTKAAKKTAAHPAAPRPTVKKTVPKVVVTTISAAIDVGFGNTLYLRGDGPGLSWDEGVPMECVADDKWTLVVTESARPVAFKFLLNDETWCAGDDYTIEAGGSITLTPEF